jgi:hypothetical protein
MHKPYGISAGQRGYFENSRRLAEWVIDTRSNNQIEIMAETMYNFWRNRPLRISRPPSGPHWISVHENVKEFYRGSASIVKAAMDGSEGDAIETMAQACHIAEWRYLPAQTGWSDCTIKDCYREQAVAIKAALDG